MLLPFVLLALGGFTVYELTRPKAPPPKPSPINPIAIPGFNLLSSALFQVGPDGIVEFSDVGCSTIQARLFQWTVTGTSPVDGAMFIASPLSSLNQGLVQLSANIEIGDALKGGFGVYLDTGALTNNTGVIVFSASETTPPISTDVQDRPPMPIDVDTAMSSPSLVRIPASAIDPSHFAF